MPLCSTCILKLIEKPVVIPAVEAVVDQLATQPSIFTLTPFTEKNFHVVKTEKPALAQLLPVLAIHLLH